MGQCNYLHAGLAPEEWNFSYLLQWVGGLNGWKSDVLGNWKKDGSVIISGLFDFILDPTPVYRIFITIVPDVPDDVSSEDRQRWCSCKPKNYKFRIIDKPSLDWVSGLPKSLATKHRYN